VERFAAIKEEVLRDSNHPKFIGISSVPFKIAGDIIIMDSRDRREPIVAGEGRCQVFGRWYQRRGEEVRKRARFGTQQELHERQDDQRSFQKGCR